MAVITNYSTLQTEVANTLARDDLTAEIPQFIQFAENELDRRLNLRNEETALSVSISSGVAAVPSDFKQLKFAYFDATPVRLLQWVSLEELYNDYPYRSDSDSPCVISREGSNFVFGPVSIDGTLKGIYYATQDPLRTTDPSWYVSNAPEALLYGSLYHASIFIRDDAAAVGYKALFDAMIDTLEEDDFASNNPQTSLAQRVL